MGHCVYIIQCNEFYKVGLSSDHQRRILELQTGNPYKLHLRVCLVYEKRSHAAYVEKWLHENLAENRKRGEWFKRGKKPSLITDKAVRILSSGDCRYLTAERFAAAVSSQGKEVIASGC